MLERKYLRNVLSPLIVIFVDGLCETFAFPVLFVLMSTQTSFLPQDTPISLRLFYLSIALMLTPFFSLFGSNYLGNLSDMIRRKNALILSVSMLCFTLFLSGVAIQMHALWLLFIARCLAGLANGSFGVATASIIDTTTKSGRPKAIAVTNFAYTLGHVVGPLLGGIFANKMIFPIFTPSTAFYFVGILCVLSLIWIALSFKQTIEIKKIRKWDWREVYTPFTRAFQHKKTRYLLPQVLCLDIGISMFLLTVWTYMSETLHRSSTNIGIFMASSGALGLMTILFIVTKLNMRYGSEKLLSASQAFIAIFILLQAIFINEFAFWIIMIPTAMLSQIFYTSAYLNASHAVDSQHQGWALGITDGAISFSWLIASLGANLMSVIGIRMILFVAVGFTLLSLAFMVLARRQADPANLEQDMDPMP